ncbi:DUF4351 domain-containing protein [Methylovulum psychrotolerans]|uniref:DUF4351 domain-containing protein n=1 Tax=Methylovulum psychrotolerans TaxID=1704499 RepID=UPI001BFF8082|nr:DUF4351 domain-containing protein [Methylovulum psychrotolerans]MBT9100039.1 DUF4351 domain-containing protein [Methylovulum psychrotolerans]
MPIDHDRLFKELLTIFFTDFIALFQPELLGWFEPDSVTFLDKEIFTDIFGGERHEADLVANVRCKGGSACFLIHIETQAKRQPDFAPRMFKYFARLHEKHGLPVYPIAVLSYDTLSTPEPDRYSVAFPDGEVLAFRFRTVQLNRLNWRDYLGSHNPVASALMAKMAIEPKDRPRVKAECLRLLVTLKLDPARSRFISGFIDTYLRLQREELQIFDHLIHTEFLPTEQEQAMELTTSWKEEGIQEGLQRGFSQGMQQGIQQGEYRALIRLLTRRFQALPADVLARIEAAQPEQLEQWLDNTLDATTLDDVFRNH